MHSPHAHPVAGCRGDLDNDCIYLHHPSRRLDLQSPLALAPLSQNHSPELIDNLYLTGVYSTDSATTSAFLIHIHILEATPNDISSIITMQLNEMQKMGILNPADNFTNLMTVHPLLDTHHTTYLGGDKIIHTTSMLSPHLEGTPHAYIVTTLTFSQATSGLTLLATRQLRWTTSIPDNYINTKLPEHRKKSLITQIPTITRKNVDKPNTAKDPCAIHCHEFQGLSVIAAFNLFRTATIQTLHKHLTEVEHKHQNKTANSLDNLSQATQAILQALDSVQPSTP
jgi:hypothetical protein